MAYTPQTFSVGQVLTATEMNTMDANIDEVRRNEIGSSAPGNLTAGIEYVNNSVAGAWTKEIYDGTDWIQLFEIDESGNKAYAKNVALEDTDRIYFDGVGGGDYLLSSSGTIQVFVGSGQKTTFSATDIILHEQVSLRDPSIAFASTGAVNPTFEGGDTDGVFTLANQSDGVGGFLKIHGSTHATAADETHLGYDATNIVEVGPGVMDLIASVLRFDGSTVLRMDSGATKLGNATNSAIITLSAGGTNTALAGALVMSSGQILYLDGGSNTYIRENGADNMELVTGGTAALTLGSSQAATFAGDVGVGASRASDTGFSRHLNIEGSDCSIQLHETTGNQTWEIGNDSTGLLRILDDGSNKLTLSSSILTLPVGVSLDVDDGRMTITQDDTSGNFHTIQNNVNEDWVVRVEHYNVTSTSPYGINVLFSAASPDDNTNRFMTWEDSTTARFHGYSDGDLANHDGVYGTISHRDTKHVIEDVRSYVEDFMNLRYRKWKSVTDVEQYGEENAPWRLGLVHDEAEEVFPSCVAYYDDYKRTECFDENGNALTDPKTGNPLTINVKKPERSAFVKSSIIDGTISSIVLQEVCRELFSDGGILSRLSALEAA